MKASGEHWTCSAARLASHQNYRALVQGKHQVSDTQLEAIPADRNYGDSAIARILYGK